MGTRKDIKINYKYACPIANDHSGEIFSNQLLAIGNGKLTADSISGRIQLPSKFCNLVTSKNDLVEKVFPNILIKITNG